jgi:hypothetical protein
MNPKGGATMFRRFAIVLASTIMLLGSSVPVTLARDGSPSSPQRPTNALAAVGVYLAAINSAWRTGNFSPLAEVVAPHAVLVRTAPNGRSGVYDTRNAILSYFRDARERGALPEDGITGMQRLSASVVIAYTEAGGAGNPVASRSLQVFIVKSGMIVGCDWAVLASVQG